MLRAAQEAARDAHANTCSAKLVEERALAEARAQHDLRVELSQALREVRASAETDLDAMQASHAAETRQIVREQLLREQSAVENAVNITESSAHNTAQNSRLKISSLESESVAKQTEINSLRETHRRYRDEVLHAETNAEQKHREAVSQAASSAMRLKLPTAMPCED